MARFELSCVGEAFEDLIFLDLPSLPKAGEEVKTRSFVRTLGGGAVITAVAAARLGLPCSLVTALGNEAQSRLETESIEVKNLRRSGEASAISAALSTTEDRSFVTYNGVNDQLEERLLGQTQGWREARHVHFALCPRSCEKWVPVLAELRDLEISTSWDFGWNPQLLEDPALFPLLEELTLLFLNEKELLLYAGTDNVERAFDFWVRTLEEVVMKLGKKGSIWLSSGNQIEAPAIEVKVTDTTGAGDAFNGGFLFAFLTGRNPLECLQVGNRVGGLSTLRAGGIDGLPRQRDLR